ncbi:hypothetical protein AAFF_G00412540 [Aldrovandia affinis]|uniref:Uncharacterized protein n=1 Tax=Aldrovandia affinis TaxID=143900 RepID=A0AAD7SD90_9TELE|nr:hypothetical protein AAFF_G00412540 [Aldrovandia affinis]
MSWSPGRRDAAVSGEERRRYTPLEAPPLSLAAVALSPQRPARTPLQTPLASVDLQPGSRRGVEGRFGTGPREDKAPLCRGGGQCVEAALVNLRRCRNNGMGVIESPEWDGYVAGQRGSVPPCGLASARE